MTPSQSIDLSPDSNEEEHLETISQIFQSNGKMSLCLKGYEERKEQFLMALKVQDALYKKQIALIEAGTGVGKSLAYLIPALLWTQKFDEKIIISTNTIALQEQLLEKDIPLALKVLGIDVKVVLAKGMGNYTCLRKLKNLVDERSLFREQEDEQIQKIDAWSQVSNTGARSDLPFFVVNNVWEKVATDADACNNTQCEHFQKCFYFKARKALHDAKIVVVNHHLLFADLALRKKIDNSSGTGLLPNYSALILDEAHHIEDVATDYFADKISRFEILKLISILGTDKTEKQDGLLASLKQKLAQFTSLQKGFEKTLADIFHKLEIELPLARRIIYQKAQELFDALATFCSIFSNSPKGEEIDAKAIRLRKAHLEHPFWKTTLKTQMEQLIQVIQEFCLSVEHIISELSRTEKEKLQDSIKNILIDIKAANGRLLGFSSRLDSFVQLELTDGVIPDRVYWIEFVRKKEQEVALVQAEHDISSLLYKYLFSKLQSAILCSATLTTHKNFAYFRNRIGLQEHSQERSCPESNHSTDERQINLKVIEKLVSSPFSFQTQALFGIPTDLPMPDDPQFLKKAQENIQQLIEASHGNAFVLFTSYTMLQNCYEKLQEPLEAKGFHLLKHGDDSRSTLIRRFKEKNRSVLFGTDSFWEGVDIIGDALRCVIITKLPFHVPSDPIAEVRTELITKRGGNPFVEYAIPKAVVKFKQAFGRLIRHKDDRGCIICLDNRLIKKSYGNLFMQSLPKCIEVFEPLEQLTKKMRSFYSSKRK